MSLTVKILCSLAIFAVFHGAVDQADAACPTVTPMAGFNPLNFVGPWYAIRRFTTIFNGFSTACVAMNATIANRNTFNLVFCNLFSQLRPLKIWGTLLSNGVYNVKFQVGLINYEIKYIIVATDYTNYAVTYFCATMPFAPTAEVAWIFSRQRTLSQTYLDTAVAALKAKGLNTKNFVDINQSGCT